MVKVKKVQNLSLTQMLKVFFSFRVFDSKSISKMLIFVYSLIFLVLNSIISVLINHIPNFSVESDLSRIGYVILGFPIVILLVFVVFYVILNAFENNHKSFIEGYLVFLAILLPFFTVGNLVNYVGQLLVLNYVLSLIIPIFYMLLIVYLAVMLAGNFKFYYGTSIYRIITTYVISYVLFFVIIFPSYLSTYLASL